MVEPYPRDVLEISSTRVATPLPPARRSRGRNEKSFPGFAVRQTKNRPFNRWMRPPPLVFRSSRKLDAIENVSDMFLISLFDVNSVGRRIRMLVILAS